MLPSRFTRRHLSDVLAATAREFPDRPGLIFQGDVLTWQEVDAQVNALAKALLELGVDRGDRVGIFCPPRPEYLITCLAVTRIGAILTGFNVHYTAREIIEYGRLVNPMAMFTISELGVATQLDDVLAELPSVIHRIGIGGDGLPTMLTFDDLLSIGAALPDAPLGQRMAQREEEDGALIVFTGGTTGMPKPALLSHKNIVANITAQNREVGFRHDDRLIQHLPMNHVSGCVLISVGALMAGAALYFMDRFRPVEALELIREARITILGQVPPMFAMETLAPNFPSADLSSLRMAIVAGAPTPPTLMVRIGQFAPITIHGYGLTETGGMVTYTAPGAELETLLHSAGKAPSEVEMRIVDEERVPLSVGKIGEIALRGDFVMSGYYGDPAATAQQIDADGWLYTGDLGRLHVDGSVEITGRSKEMYISGGYNVYPIEIETYLQSHPAIADCACIGRPDPIMGEQGMVFIVPAPGANLRAGDVREFCKQGLARYKNPRYIEFVAELPRTDLGKIDKQALARPFLPPVTE
ncbi:MAG: acyl--CoA ligase [Caldilineaceae bacterium]|nr:acyl--CoA ligase [Caldilineaceae bacterium]